MIFLKGEIILKSVSLGPGYIFILILLFVFKISNTEMCGFCKVTKDEKLLIMVAKFSNQKSNKCL